VIYQLTNAKGLFALLRKENRDYSERSIRHDRSAPFIEEHELGRRAIRTLGKYQFFEDSRRRMDLLLSFLLR
jgi:hypothetical protein